MQRWFSPARLAFIIAFACSANVPAQDIARLYAREKLQRDAETFGAQINAEYRETILPQLTAEEREALAAIQLEFPVAGPKGDPFEFYTDGRAIYLPALSLRFFADLCVAHAWLNAHGFDGTAVRDYVGLLFREATVSPHAPLKPVFETLGVPANARDESAVANRATRNFGNVVVLLLAHELGHVLKKHRTDATDPAQQRRQEIEADQFAIEIMRRIGQIPLGAELWFDLERIRHVAPLDYSDEAKWQKYLAGLTHPVTRERMEAFAEAIEKDPDSFARKQTNPQLWRSRARMFAQMFRLSAPFSDNAVARAAEYSRVRQLRQSWLKPRKPGFTAPAGDGSEEDFQGLFRIRRTFADGTTRDEFDLLLLRNGDEVTGSYSTDAVKGSITGTVTGTELHLRWGEGPKRGRARLEMSGATLRGSWGTDESQDGAGKWEGARVTRQ